MTYGQNTENPKDEIEVFESIPTTTTVGAPTTTNVPVTTAAPITTTTTSESPSTQASNGENDIESRRSNAEGPTTMIETKGNEIGYWRPVWEVEPGKSMKNVMTLLNLMEEDKGRVKDFKEWREKWEKLWKEGRKFLPLGPYGPWGDSDFDSWYRLNCPPYYGEFDS